MGASRRRPGGILHGAKVAYVYHFRAFPNREEKWAQHQREASNSGFELEIELSLEFWVPERRVWPP